MQNITRKVGSTDVSVVIRIVDLTDGSPETAVTSATGGLALEYRRELATSTAITESDLAAVDSAHSDGGMKHIGNGYYRLDLPDAACAAGSAGCVVHGTATNMVVVGCYIDLTQVPADVTHWLGTAAATPAVAGRPSVDAIAISGDTATADNLQTAFQTTLAESAAVPAANASIWAKVAFLATKARNKITQTATTQTVYADDGTTPVAASTVSDNGTTATRNEFV